MKAGSVLSILALFGVWIILRENVTLFTLISGVVVSFATWKFCRSYLPLGKMKDVRLIPMLGYPFFLIGQVYAAGFFIAKLVFTGADVEIIRMKTKLSNESLRVILVDSITLTPGSILLDQQGEDITLLWLKDPRKPLSPEQRDELLKGSLERYLMKCEK